MINPYNNAKNTFENKEWLTQKYLIEGLTVRKIAQDLGLNNHNVIVRNLKLFNIPSRGFGAKKGVGFSEEHKNKIAEACLGRTAWNKGKALTLEQRKKISIGMKKND